MKELISILERNIQIENWINENNKKEKDQNFTMSIALDLIFIYTYFCNLKLNIGMFVPAVEVEGKWKILEKPKYPKQGSYEALMTDVSVFRNLDKKMEQYQKVKDNVLFEGFEIYNTPRNSHGFSVINEINGLSINFSLNQIPKYPFQTIQDLIKYKPTLTKKGLDISGLNR